MSYVVSLRIPDKETWERAKRYARKEGISLGRMVLNALELYMSRDERILIELRELKEEIRRLSYNKPLKLTEVKALVQEKGELPSYLKDNPWVEILAKRGRENIF